MDLSTTYLGMDLPHPLMPGASPMVDDLDLVKRLEDAGAAAIVMHSLFEEQVVREQLAADQHLDAHADAYAEALSYFPPSNVFALGPDAYLEQIRKVREAVKVPVIGSLNGTTPGGWLTYAKLIEEAGASALELNLYTLPTSPRDDAATVEARGLEIVRAVRAAVKIPIAVKLSPFYSSLPHFVAGLEKAGADGVVLFNRFYQPDIDIEALDVKRSLQLSDSSELLLRLRWTAILSGQTTCSLAVTGGVHSGTDALKAVMTGAHAVQLVSALLHEGPNKLRAIREEMSRWLEAHEYHSLRQAQGSMSISRCPNPSAYERGNYIRVIQGWHGTIGGSL
ncbi:MAG: dihydroorotate dehydrogenase-like protein [Byssovorax sp.]